MGILEKTLLHRLHLYDGVSVYLKTIEEIVSGLSKLEMDTLKRLFAVYTEVTDRIEMVLMVKDMGYVFNKEIVSENVSGLDSKLMDNYVSERFMTEHTSFLNDDWFLKLDGLKGEISEIDEETLKLISWKSYLTACMIESLIVTRDEYWYPKERFTLYLLSESGVSLEKKKERIWQPKTS